MTKTLRPRSTGATAVATAPKPAKPPVGTKTFHVLNLGAGVQSTTIKLLEADGELFDDAGELVKFDAAVFSDTGEEPPAVYDHLAWLETQGGCPIVKVQKGRLGEDLKKDVQVRSNAFGGKTRFASIPAFVQYENGEVAMTRRQCTREYKIEPIERWVRRELLGLKPRQRVPAGVTVVHYIGFSVDEPRRAANAKNRFRQIRWGEVEFPLWFEEHWMSRRDCESYLEKRAPHRVPRSACSFCPFRDNASWRDLRDNHPEAWQRAVEIDRAIRSGEPAAEVGMDKPMFIHRSCVPLDEAKIDDTSGQKTLWDMECEGGCGL